ncbi:hypothetical protein [Blastococcus aggregatus]|uniref:hypothetical protein n=1 Tax=Blastococcus aggregatus TaxID=38502 RepID=UPI001C3EB21F|nr:hypothetical protein [Blastococcus aggregatus]
MTRSLSWAAVRVRSVSTRSCSAKTKYSGSIVWMGLSDAIAAAAVMPRSVAAGPLSTAAPISGKTSTSASPTSPRATAWASKSRASAIRRPLAPRPWMPASRASSWKVAM